MAKKDTNKTAPTPQKRKRSPAKSLEQQLEEIRGKIASAEKSLAKKRATEKSILRRMDDRKKAEEDKITQEAAKRLVKITEETGLSFDDLAEIAKHHKKED